MSFETALRATEILMALAFIQQSSEHFQSTPRLRWLYALRILTCLVLISGLATGLCLMVLCALSLVTLHVYNGPYNGGSDRMSLLILWCLSFATWAPTPFWQTVFLSYLALQLTLSYFMSGKVKLRNPDWRKGHALRDVFAFSAYPVSRDLRRLADYPRLLGAAGWAVIGFEVLFPLALLHPVSLAAALVIAGLFHLANACLFGLNRFFWIWLAAYPALIWLQTNFL